MSNVCLIIITDGRRSYLSQTMDSVKEHLRYPFCGRIIVDDSGDPTYHTFLTNSFPEFQTISHPNRRGLPAAINTAWKSYPENTEYIFHLEDDFTFNKAIDIQAMVDILMAQPHLVQLALKRQSVNMAEANAGGFMQQHPEYYTNKDGWVEHTAFFTLNPNIYRVQLTHTPYPDHGDESVFTGSIKYPDGATLNDGVRFGFLGQYNDPPLIEHIGSKRSEAWTL